MITTYKNRRGGGREGERGGKRGGERENKVYLQYVRLNRKEKSLKIHHFYIYKKDQKDIGCK